MLLKLIFVVHDPLIKQLYLLAGLDNHLFLKRVQDLTLGTIGNLIEIPTKEITMLELGARLTNSAFSVLSLDVAEEKGRNKKQ